MGVLNFIIFGKKHRGKQHGPTFPIHCPNCRNDEVYHVAKERAWGHIFWVPLLPLGADRFLICPTCGAEIGLTKDEYADAIELSEKTEKYSQGELTEQQYVEAVREFEAQSSFIEDTEDTESVGQTEPPKVEPEG